jgi:hypothetical protein
MRDVFERMAWDMAFAKKSVRTQKKSCFAPCAWVP